MAESTYRYLEGNSDDRKVRDFIIAQNASSCRKYCDNVFASVLKLCRSKEDIPRHVVLSMSEKHVLSVHKPGPESSREVGWFATEDLLNEGINTTFHTLSKDTSQRLFGESEPLSATVICPPASR